MHKNVMGTRSSRAAVLALSAALTLSLSACGGEDSTVSARPGTDIGTGAGAISETKNKTDIAFIQGMSPHHESAIDMTDLAADRAQSPEVKQLAERIAAAQEPEIKQMKEMAETWGVELSGGDSGGHGGGGPMTMGDVSALESQSGPAFDRAFLQMMIPHHEDALPISRTEIEQGANPQAKALAQDIIESQTAEIEEMKQLLTRL